MVLANASTPTSNGGFDDMPPNDNDQFNSNGEGGDSPRYLDARTLVQNPSLPSPCPGMGVFGYNTQILAVITQKQIQQAQKVMGRNPTEEEVNSFVYWKAKQLSVMSYGAPIGVSAGLYRAYTSAAEFRFPFLKPNPEKFNPEAFITSKLKLFEGQRARMAWHALRSASYGAGGFFIGSLLFASYATSVAAVGEISDKRLKDYVAAMKRAAQEAQGKRAGVIPPPTDQNGAPQAGPREMQRVGGRSPPSRVQEVDDASPTGGAFWDENDNNLAEKGWKSANDPSYGRVEAKIEADSMRRRGRDDRISQPKPEVERDVFDDMSPTGGASIVEEAPSGESAWDRLRRQNAAGSPPPANSKYGDRNN